MLILIAAGCLLDFSVGIALQAHIESMENTPQRVVFSGLHPAADQGPPGLGAQLHHSLSATAWTNWFRKHQYALSTQWLRELTDSIARTTRLFNSKRLPLHAQLESWVNEDQKYWYGWYARHDGTMTFLGDHVAGPSGHGGIAAMCLLAGLFLALMSAFVKEGWNLLRHEVRPRSPDSV